MNLFFGTLAIAYLLAATAFSQAVDQGNSLGGVLVLPQKAPPDPAASNNVPPAPAASNNVPPATVASSSISPPPALWTTIPLNPAPSSGVPPASIASSSISPAPALWSTIPLNPAPSSGVPPAPAPSSNILPAPAPSSNVQPAPVASSNVPPAPAPSSNILPAPAPSNVQPAPVASSNVPPAPAPSSSAPPAPVPSNKADQGNSSGETLVLAQNTPPDNAPSSNQALACQNPGGVNGIDPSCWDTLDWYIAYNIYAINQVFNSLYMAIGNANTLAGEKVGAIVAFLDPPQKSSVLTNDILTAISACINIILPVGTLFQRHFIALTQQSPPVSKFLFPVGTVQSQLTQWSAIQQELSQIVQAYQTNVSQIIPTIVNDIDLFVTFAESGAFSVNPLPDMSGESDKLLIGLQTYVISKALQANNVVIGQSTNTDINQLVANSTDQLAFDTGCPGMGYNNMGMCGPFYFDNITGNSFSLDDLGDMRKNYTNELSIVLGNWTTGDMLFGGAYRCQNEGGVKGSLANTVISTNGNVSLDCLSDIQVCEWNLGSLDVDKEFTNCPSQIGYVVNGCGGGGCGEDGIDVNVPNGYLGRYLVNPNSLDCVCNT
ncbi:hypothetical protein OEA41_009842 [Lepraria neglecta]|uniref:Uncharacterized protein n=1 Tax=Lepraria neglecta TaxID=209136 RepID=A0AAD9YYQ1_9LECA|nr:hypothetical protein OEA41_009842 [Lepraria neglecta]